jgi:ubiquitin fusion degradation protein 1
MYFHITLPHDLPNTPANIPDMQDRAEANTGGKIFLPASALDKLTRLHITYPMLFSLHNGSTSQSTHAGVLEFIAEEGKAYLPHWLMRTLSLEPGDLVQIKSTDLPLGTFIKLQPQSPDFLDITDPKAVLENAFRSFACLTTGDVFQFAYNDQTYDIKVLETRPEGASGGICTLETDLEVDFATPVGYEEPTRTSGTSTPGTGAAGQLAKQHGVLHSQGTMAQAINYADIAPTSTHAAAGARALSSNFHGSGQKLVSKKGSKAPTPKPSTPVAGASSNVKTAAVVKKRTNGPQPLRLPHGKLFFGYEIKPVKKKEGEQDETEKESVHFQGQGQSLRKKKGDGK